MSALSSLKLVAAKRPTQMPAVQVRRNKLAGKLHHQIKLAEALSLALRMHPLACAQCVIDIRVRLRLLKCQCMYVSGGSSQTVVLWH